MTAPPAPLGLYIHWPYCARICPYCDFNVYKARGEDGALIDAILADLAAWRAYTGARPLVSLHVGGGTPSLLPPRDLDRLIETADTLWGFTPGAEIGVEANPDDAANFAGLAAAGANRVSLGVQAFDDSALKALGRNHDAAAARAAIAAAQNAFERVSLDLIYAREGQSLGQWRAELAEALECGTEHLSLYQLTLEPGTAFARRAARGDLVTPDADGAADFHEIAQEMCEAAGLPAYEISNHARGAAARSVHNSLYWTGGDWIGAGPGGHSRLGSHAVGGRLAAAAERRPADYAARIARGGRASVEETALTAREEARERVAMGLRIAEGLDRAALRAATGLDIDAAALDGIAAQGLAVADGDVIRLTPAGRLLADRIAVEISP